ncbi:hypothetical protein D1BOALGB6SA_197 [Olavius sp. associated proteobacterium Delta 1]|nr:hypothetical protein D1BOALGB6SA_197 [Olavius sp. associated proteobacterium Delta 1]
MIEPVRKSLIPESAGPLPPIQSLRFANEISEHPFELEFDGNGDLAG